MTELKLKVADNAVSVTNKTEQLTAGGVNDIKCTFNLPDEYSGLVIRAVFNNVAVTTEESTCYAPVLDEGRCCIGVYAYESDGDTLNLRYSPTPCIEYVHKGSFSDDVAVETTPTPSELEQYYQLIKELMAETKGAKGDKGDKGDTGDSGATFTPSVSEDGVMSWSNDKELENPPDVDLTQFKFPAANVTYDNTNTGMSSENVQDAIDGLWGLIKVQTGSLQPKSWSDVSDIVKAGIADKVFNIGDQFVCNHETYGELVWDVIEFDCEKFGNTSIEHSMTLGLHGVLPDPMPYACKEALFIAPTNIAARTYYFALPDKYATSVGETAVYVNFTLTNTLAKGSALIWQWDGTSDPTNVVMYVYDDIYTQNVLAELNVALGAEGTEMPYQKQLNEFSRCYKTYTYYPESFINEFLNSTSTDEKWWTQKNSFQLAPKCYSSLVPLKIGLDNDFINVLGNISKVCYGIKYADGGNLNITRGGIQANFFLLSRDEVNGIPQNINNDEYNEGSVYAYYDFGAASNNLATKRRKKGSSNTNVDWWLRSSDLNTQGNAGYVYRSGKINSASALKDYYISPCCVIV